MAGERRALDRSLEGMRRKAVNIRVSRAQQSMHDRADQFGRLDLPDAEAHLRHYLTAKGTPIRYSRDKARTFEPVRELEATIQHDFKRRTFQGIADKNPDPPRLLSMKDGATIKVIDDFNVSTANMKSDKKEPGFDLNAAKALGDTKMKSKGRFVATRKGNMITITGTVVHDWGDEYDFNDDKTKTSGPGAADGRTLEEAGAARPFKFSGTWRQKVEATVERRNGRLFTRDVKWTDLNE